jgi:hypothetical protein
MRNFTLRKGFLGSKCGTRSSFKGFVMLVVMMLMTTSSAMAQGARFEVIDGLRYLLDTGAKTAALMPKTDSKYSGDIVVPEKVNSSDGMEYVVTSFEKRCFYDCSGIKAITIPSSVTLLGDGCFSYCSSLTSMTIPSSVISLGNYCFSGCSGLTSITILSSVTSLGDGCFSDCSGLTSITIPNTVTSLGDYCFSGCSGLTSITIPSSVTSLGRCCFSGSGIKAITIPSSVTLLGDGCFSYCSSLTSITIPSSVTSLDSFCFSGCSGLISITIPSSVTSLGWHCFEDCQNLETVYFKGKYCKSNYADLKIPTTSIIKVPTEYLQGYKDSFGSDYKYISAWNPNGTGDDSKPVTQCSTPSISYETGKLMFACETTGAKYNYTITDTDIKSDALSENGEVSLSAAYHISVYATADGYKASDKAEATLYWINANLENGTNINQVRTRGVVASAHDGIISLSGLDDGEVVKFFAADGKYLGSTVAANGAASYAVSESLVIAKVGKDSIKIAMK